MTALKEKELIKRVNNYYHASGSAYRNWGAHPTRGGIYAIHSGYYPEESKTDHFQSLENMRQKIVELAQIKPRQLILDAGCGTGDIAFEIALRFPDVRIVGINVVLDQLTTTQAFKLKQRVENTSFILQDYSKTAFPDSIFDRVIFCESLAHAFDKKAVLQETKRLLKPEGMVIIADVFLLKERPEREQKALISDYQEGWIIPNVIQIKEFTSWLIELGFENIRVTDRTENSLPSAKHMADHAAFRLQQEPYANEILTKSRKTCIAIYKLLKQKVFGAFFIIATLKTTVLLPTNSLNLRIENRSLRLELEIRE